MINTIVHTQPIVMQPVTQLIPRYMGEPLLPEPRRVGVTSYDTRSRLVRWSQSNASVIGVSLAACAGLAHAITQILVGA